MSCPDIDGTDLKEAPSSDSPCLKLHSFWNMEPVYIQVDELHIQEMYIPLLKVNVDPHDCVCCPAQRISGVQQWQSLRKGQSMSALGHGYRGYRGLEQDSTHCFGECKGTRAWDVLTGDLPSVGTKYSIPFRGTNAPFFFLLGTVSWSKSQIWTSLLRTGVECWDCRPCGDMMQYGLLVFLLCLCDSLIATGYRLESRRSTRWLLPSRPPTIPQACSVLAKSILLHNGCARHILPWYGILASEWRNWLKNRFNLTGKLSLKSSKPNTKQLQSPCEWFLARKHLDNPAHIAERLIFTPNQEIWTHAFAVQPLCSRSIFRSWRTFKPQLPPPWPIFNLASDSVSFQDDTR